MASLSGLLEYLHKCFSDELERGMTYPQEILPGGAYSRDQFDAYYFAADVLVAVLGHTAQDGRADPLDGEDGSPITTGFADAVGGRSWEECIAGCYYVSPRIWASHTECTRSIVSVGRPRMERE